MLQLKEYFFAQKCEDGWSKDKIRRNWSTIGCQKKTWDYQT